MYSPPSDPADEQRMIDAHEQAAAALAVSCHGTPAWGWLGRTISRPGTDAESRSVWLRLVAVPEAKAHGKLWDGIKDAAEAFGDLDGRRPALLGLYDWIDCDTAYRADLAPLLTEAVCSASPLPRQDLALPDLWWTTLRDTLDTVAKTPTDRTAVRQEWADRVVPQLIGVPSPRLDDAVTVHGDMHWANLTTGTPIILDWEGWGRGPAGFDAAMLHAYSLVHPKTAARVRQAFPILDSPAGRAAEIVVTASLLQSIDRGDHPDLAQPLRLQAERLRTPAA